MKRLGWGLYGAAHKSPMTARIFIILGAFDADGNGTNESTGMTDDPTVAGAANATAFDVSGLVTPTLSDAALALLALLMLDWGASRVRRARVV